MSLNPHQHLRIVTEEGELLDKCPNCEELEKQLAGATTDIRAWRSRYADLKADRDKQARGHNLWPRAVALFRYWQQLTGHDRTKFTPDRFWLLEPFLRREGDADCRSAIRGCLQSDFHMKRGAYANRGGPIHDKLEQIFATQGKFEGFRDMDPDLEPTLSQRTLIEHAQEVAGRILERAKLIEKGDDPVAISHLLLEVNRLLVEWMRMPQRAERGEEDFPAESDGKPEPDPKPQEPEPASPTQTALRRPVDVPQNDA